MKNNIVTIIRQAHGVGIDNYNRDDCGFYLKCIHCNEDIIFEVDTESDLYELFGIERDDYDDSLEDDYYDYYDDDY